MSTEYDLYKDDNFGELTIDESSNELSFLMNTPDGWDIWLSIKMTPEEMAKIFLVGLTVCSYWMDTDELKEMIQNHIEKEIY